MPPIQIEERPYNEDCTPEELQALRARMRILEDNILYYQEIPVETLFSVKNCFEYLEEITKPFKHFYFIVDLTEATHRPNAEIRASLSQHIISLRGRLKHIACFTGRNFLINVAAKFVINNYADSSSVDKTFEEALEKVRQQKQKWG